MEKTESLYWLPQGEVVMKQYTQTGSDGITNLLNDVVITAQDSFTIDSGVIQGSGTIDGPVIVGSSGTIITQKLTTGTFENSGTWQVEIVSQTELTTISVKVLIFHNLQS